MAPFIGQKKGEDQKKGLPRKTRWFSVPKYVMTQKKKGLRITISGFSVSKKKQIVSPQNGDTRGGPPPLATPQDRPPFANHLLKACGSHVLGASFPYRFNDDPHSLLTHF